MVSELEEWIRDLNTNSNSEYLEELLMLALFPHADRKNKPTIKELLNSSTREQLDEVYRRIKEARDSVPELAVVLVPVNYGAEPEDKSDTECKNERDTESGDTSDTEPNDVCDTNTHEPDTNTRDDLDTGPKDASDTEPNDVRNTNNHEPDSKPKDDPKLKEDKTD